MTETSVPDEPGADERSESPRSAVEDELAARARYEREAAALDLSDAEQSAVDSSQDGVAAALHESADRHRLLAERLEAGDASALLDADPIRPGNDRREA